MDRDGVDAEVIYPTPRLANALVANTNVDYHVAMLQAYNDWLSEYVGDAPERFGGLAILPNRGVERAVAELQVVFAEVDFGWVPYVKEQIDNNYQRLEPVSRFGLQALPSEYIARHFHFSYMTDTFGLRNWADVGAERILWSSDYPHISADWPFSWRVIQASMSGVPAAARQLILAGNAQRLYGFSQEQITRGATSPSARWRERCLLDAPR
jgi:predicted TIM-barrel fold metal-dependent hydrolase